MALSMAQVAKKQFESLILEFKKEKIAGSDEEKAGGGK